MNIDFNNARKQACYSYSRLVDRLNDCIDDGKLRIDAEEVEDLFNELRTDLILIAATYQKDNPELLCVMDEITTIATFNPEF